MDIESSPKRCIIRSVEISSRAFKELEYIPKHIISKLKAWRESIEQDGLLKTRNTRGYSDEALKGKRKGQRSVRLNKAYRVIYTIKENHIVIEEVNKHDY